MGTLELEGTYRWRVPTAPPQEAIGEATIKKIQSRDIDERVKRTKFRDEVAGALMKEKQS